MTQVLDESKFYEGKFTASFDYNLENPVYRFYLQHSIYRADWISFEWVKPSRMLLDIGCGGGKSVLRNKAQKIIGIDLSVESLKQASRLYDWVVVANVDALPFKDNTFDCVYSAHLLGHIPEERKDAVLSGLKRITVAGGENVHYIETDGDNAVVRFAKKFPDLYHKNYIEYNGHFGLEAPSKALARISDCFKVLQCRKFNSGIYSVEGTLLLLDGYRDKNWFLNMIWPFYSFINKSGLLRRLMNLLLGPVMRLYSRMTSFDAADWIVVRCAKA